MSDLTQTINAQVSGVVRVPAGSYLIDQPVTVRCAVEIEPGACLTVAAGISITMGSGSAFGGATRVKPTIIKQGDGTLFNVAGSDVNLHDFSIDNSQATGGWDVMIDTATCGREYIYLDRIRTTDSYGVIADNSGAGIIVNLHLTDVMARRHRGRGSWLTRAFAFTYLKKCCIDYINSLTPAATNIPAWVFFGAEGLELESVDVLGTATNGQSGLQYGYYFENCRALTLNKVMADNCGGLGFSFKGCNWVYGDKVKASQGGDIGFIFSNGTQNVFLDQFYAGGRKGLAGDHGAALFYTDDTVRSINMTDGMSESYSGPMFGGSAGTKISFINHRY